MPVGFPWFQSYYLASTGQDNYNNQSWQTKIKIAVIVIVIYFAFEEAMNQRRPTKNYMASVSKPSETESRRNVCQVHLKEIIRERNDIIGSCVFCAPLDRYIGRHIDRQSTDVSVDISAECRPICRSTYRSSVGRYVDRDVSLDISADISVEHRSICRLTLDRCVGRYFDWEWLSDCRPTCRSIGYRHSADTSLLLAYWWL